MIKSRNTGGIAPACVVCCPIAPEVGHKKANLDKTAEFTVRAAREGAQVIVVPEFCSSGYVFESRAEASSLADAYVDGETISLWVDLARDLDIYVVGGFAEKSYGELFNAAAVIGPQGRIGLFQKVHLWGDENLFLSAGDLGFPVFSTEYRTVGVGICYDGWFPEFYRTCASKDAELVCVSTNWVPIQGQNTKRGAIANILTMTSALANSIYIAAADRVGVERGQLFIGQSLITSYAGWPIGGPASPTEEEVILANLDLASTRRARRWNDFNQVLRDRRPDAYQ